MTRNLPGRMGGLIRFGCGAALAVSLTSSIIPTPGAAALRAQSARDEKIAIGIPNFGRVNDRYYRGAQPKPDQYQKSATLGIKTVVDLREEAEAYSQPSAEQAGLRYVNFPLNDKQRPPADAATRSLKIVDGRANWPVFVHCAGGRHRTGAMTAVYRMTEDGWSIDQAYAEMKEFSFYTHDGHQVYKDYVYDYYRDLQSKGQKSGGRNR